MGIIDKAIGKVLEAVPLNKAIGQIPILKTIKWTYKAGKAGYQLGTYIDKKTNLSGKTADGIINHYGPASKGFIDKVDKLSGMLDKGKGLYNKGMGMYQNAVDKAKSMAGLNQSGVLTQNPSASKKLGSFVQAAVTKAPGTTPARQKIVSTKSGLGKLVKSIKPASAHPVKAHKTTRSSPVKTAFNPATNKMFSIKQQAAKTKFNAMTSKAFTIKQQPSRTKFNAATSKAFTLKTLSSPAKKSSPLKIKTFTPAKSSGMPKTNLAKSPFKSSFSLKTLNRPNPVHRSPSINRPVMRSVPLKK